MKFGSFKTFALDFAVQEIRNFICQILFAILSRTVDNFDKMEITLSLQCHLFKHLYFKNSYIRFEGKNNLKLL